MSVGGRAVSVGWRIRMVGFGVGLMAWMCLVELVEVVDGRYGQMKSRAGKRQREEKDQKKEE